MANIKCVIIGDADMKTVLNNYISDRPKDQQTPTVFDHFSKDVQVDKKRVKLVIWSLIEEKKESRKMCYPETDVLFICFSVVEPDLFYRVSEKWLQEVKRHCPKTPRILVGIDIELRDDKETIKNLKKRKLKPVSTNDGLKMAKKIKAVKYLECSASRLESLKHVFDEVVRAVVNKRAEKSCVIL